jgi:hypothetical protein
MTLPPMLEPFRPAPPGVYRLRPSGETVADPDYLVEWRIRAPAEDRRRIRARRLRPGAVAALDRAPEPTTPDQSGPRWLEDQPNTARSRCEGLNLNTDRLRSGRT